MSKISELSDGGALQSTDYLIAVRSGGNVKVQLSELPSGIGAGGNIVFGDNEKAIFGAGSDLEIYHSGTHSIINETGTGELKIQATNLRLQSASGGENYLTADLNGAVRVYYDDAQKFQTTATGIDVTGTVTADGLTVDVGTVSGAYAVISNTEGTAKFGTDSNYARILDGSNNILMAQSNAESYYYNNGVKVIKTASGGDISFYEDTGTTPKFFWDASAERLGIGTASPSTQLHISGSNPEIRLSDTDNTNYSSIQNVDGNMIYEADAGNQFGNSRHRWKIDGSEAMRIDASGNVGIGTSSPERLLHVNGGTENLVARFESTDTATAIEFKDSTGTVTLETRNDFRFKSGATINAIIDASGRVGIGTSSPGSPLEVTVASGTSGSASGFRLISADGGGYSIYPTSAVANPVWNTNVNSGEQLSWSVGGSEAGRFDTSGNLLVGQTTQSPNTIGVSLNNNGNISAKRDDGVVGVFNRATSDGDVISIRKDNSTVGSIGTNSGYLYIGGTAGNDAFISFGADGVRPATSAGDARDAAIDLGGVTNRFRNAYLSGGVYLGGTGAANKLDDYEEGTFTPTVEGAVAAGSGTYSVQQGKYTKIGDTVHFQIYLTWSAHTGSGAMQIHGLPFTTAGSNTRVPFVFHAEKLNTGSSFVSALSAPSDTFIIIQQYNSDAATSNVNIDTDVGPMFISGTYKTTA